MQDETKPKVMVVGMLFHGNFVAMVQKTHPNWQRGLFNGIGGGVNAGGETLHEAMTREFLEETGIRIASEQWDLFAEEHGTNMGKYDVYFFRHRIPHENYPLPDLPKLNDDGEELFWMPIRPIPDSLARKMVGNCRWLIPMALDWRGITAVVNTSDDIRERASW